MQSHIMQNWAFLLKATELVNFIPLKQAYSESGVKQYPESINGDVITSNYCKTAGTNNLIVVINIQRSRF